MLENSIYEQIQELETINRVLYFALDTFQQKSFTKAVKELEEFINDNQKAIKDMKEKLK